MKREKVGDILVFDDGADILVKAETAETLKQELRNPDNDFLDMYQIALVKTFLKKKKNRIRKLYIIWWI